MSAPLFDGQKSKERPCPFCNEPIIRIQTVDGPAAVDATVPVYKTGGDYTATLAGNGYRADHRLVCIVIREAREKAAMKVKDDDTSVALVEKLKAAQDEHQRLVARIGELEEENAMLAGDPEPGG